MVSLSLLGLPLEKEKKKFNYNTGENKILSLAIDVKKTRANKNMTD